jgi:prepilin-type N-terminal cleavage/methylation domain-containing protein
MSGRRRIHRRRGGFTLVELLIALAAGSFTISAAYALASLSATNYTAQTQVGETQVGVRTAMEQIRRDFGRAGFLGARNITEHPDCGSVPVASPAPGAGEEIRGLRVLVDGSMTPEVRTLLDEPNNPTRVDRVTLWGNYATSDAYRMFDKPPSLTELRFQTTKDSFRRSFFDPGTGGNPSVYNPARLAAAFEDRWVRIESNGRYWFRAVASVNTTAGSEGIVLVDPLPEACAVEEGIVISPLSRITYRVTDLDADAVASAALSRLRSAGTPGSERAVLIRQEENIQTTAVDDLNSVRLVLDYATEFVVNAVVNTQPAGMLPEFFERTDATAPDVEDSPPEQFRSLRVRISARSADANPNLPQVPRADRNAPFVAFQVPIAGAVAGSFWASVRTLSAEIFLPNLVSPP